ncbi:MAG: hypothetical protein H7222_09685 [Methylotenera sp.]|nr:hypothetical protein [Oligoflexia bacterium]
MPPLLLYFTLLLGVPGLLAFFKIGKAQVPGKTIHLLRAFFPSWRFFEDFGEVPALQIRMVISGEFGPWEQALPKTRRSPTTLLLHAQGNFLLAAGSLLQQFLSDLEDHQDLQARGLANGEISELVTYQLVQDLALDQFRRSHPKARHCQFKLCTLIQDEENPLLSRVDDVLLSPVLAVNS